MGEIVFKVIELAVMAVAAIVARYAVPYLRQRIDAGKAEQIAGWARQGVLYAQQMLSDQPGRVRKEVVFDFVKRLCAAGDVAMTDEQIEVLIEAAVKQMRIAEGAGGEAANG